MGAPKPASPQRQTRLTLCGRNTGLDVLIITSYPTTEQCPSV
jgi:hypothetical protein